MRLLAFRPRPEEAPAPEPEPRPAGPTPPWRGLLRVPRPRDLREMLRRNPGLKLVSLGLAFLLWLSINLGESGAERTLELQLAPPRIAGDLVVTNLPPQVAVRIRGPRTILDGVDEHRTLVRLDLLGAEPGERWVEFGRDMIHPDLKARLKVVRFEPQRLRVRVERVVRKAVPVRPELAGMPAMGYTVAESAVTPERVEAIGPASKVEELKEVVTEAVNLHGATTAVQRDVLLSWTGDQVRFKPDHVLVRVTLEEVVVSREFEHVAVRVFGVEARRVQLRPPWVNVTVRGPQRLLQSYRIPEGAVYVDATGLTARRQQVNVRFDLPAPLEVTRREPAVHLLELEPERER
jgi:YbbR domain-containing protein